jgi:hypothetical protein
VGRLELEGLVLDRWASRRRHELLQLLDQLNPWIADLDRAVMQEVQSRPDTGFSVTANRRKASFRRRDFSGSDWWPSSHSLGLPISRTFTEKNLRSVKLCCR